MFRTLLKSQGPIMKINLAACKETIENLANRYPRWYSPRDGEIQESVMREGSDILASLNAKLDNMD